MFNNIYKDKKVLVTGNTGFKGSWLTLWLMQLGAEVVGVSNEVPSNPSLFEILELESKIKHYWADITDAEKVKEIIKTEEPDLIFHLAAQALVSVSYADPLSTLQTNIMGTANVMDAIKSIEHDCTAVIITSDKCYDNVEWEWGYKETDRLAGKDIYSGSKSGAEIVFYSYYHSFIKNKGNIKIATTRAGNVIGGGDWALDRIVPDTMKAWSEGNAVEIRSPKATRPWQHVLEPLSGYLHLAAELQNRNELSGESFNVGPRSEYSNTVVELLQGLSQEWKLNESETFKITDNIPFHEAGLLKLNCDKALFHLKWVPTLDYEMVVRFTGQWYYEYYVNNSEMFSFTSNQIKEYENIASEQNLIWT